MLPTIELVDAPLADQAAGPLRQRADHLINAGRAVGAPDDDWPRGPGEAAVACTRELRPWLARRRFLQFLIRTLDPPPA